MIAEVQQIFSKQKYNLPMLNLICWATLLPISNQNQQIFQGDRMLIK